MDQAEQLRIIKAMRSKDSSSVPAAARVLTVTSGKGGVGKSNTSINLAIQFRKMGKRVIILDADFGLANIEIMFGAIPKYNLFDLISQEKNIKEIITKGPMEVGFISGGSGISAMANLSHNDLTYIIQNLKELDSIADIIIIDTGAGISDAVLEFLVASREILLVTTPEPTSITDSYSLLKALYCHPSYQAEETIIRMIANRVDKDADGENLYKKLNSVVTRYLKSPIVYLGSVPQDTNLTKAVMQQTPVSLQNPSAKSSQAYERLAAKLENKEVEEKRIRTGMANFFSKFISSRKK